MGKPLVTVAHGFHLVLTWWKFHKYDPKTKVVRGCISKSRELIASPRIVYMPCDKESVYI